MREITCLLVVAGLFCASGFSAPATGPDAAGVADLLRRLSDDDFRVREAASAELAELPGDALPFIEKAIAAGNLEPEVLDRLEMKLSLLRRRAVATVYQQQWLTYMRWHRDLLVDAYRHGGHTNPKWDASAELGITLTMPPWVDPGYKKGVDARRDAAFAAAQSAGCDDPFIEMLSIAGLATNKKEAPKVLERYGPAMNSMMAENYPPLVKMEAMVIRTASYVTANHGLTGDAVRQKLHDSIEEALKIYPEAVSQPGIPNNYYYDAVYFMLNLSALGLDDTTEAHDKVAPMLESKIKDERARAVCHGLFDFFLVARDGLGNADKHQSGLTPEQREELHKVHVETARKSLTRAWEVEPNDPVAPIMMLWACDLGSLPREEMELWFKRSMAIDPSSLSACQYKLNYLEHHASFDEALAFGRECFEGGEWSTRIPLMLVTAHHDASRRGGDAYFKEESTWKDIADVYENHLKRYPAEYADRSYYTYFACRAEKWKVADEQFKILKDTVVPEVFGSEANVRYFKRKAAANAGGE